MLEEFYLRSKIIPENKNMSITLNIWVWDFLFVFLLKKYFTHLQSNLSGGETVPMGL